MILDPKISADTDRSLDDFERTVSEEDARRQLDEIISFVRGEAQELEIHAVERHLFQRLLLLGLVLLRLFLAKRGVGRARDAVTSLAGVRLPFHEIKPRAYLSIFGEVTVRRARYWKKGETGVAPLDAELNLPQQKYSYVLQEFGALLAVSGSFGQVTKKISTFFGVKFWSQGVQSVAGRSSADVDSFYKSKSPPSPDSEGEILIASIDGKGVPLNRRARGRRMRLNQGERPARKKEAVIGAVYTVDPHERTAADLIREIDDDNFIVEPAEPRKPRPKIRHKVLRATMHGKDEMFAELKRQLDQRDPAGTKQRVVLTDGDKHLQRRSLERLGNSAGAVLILDLMHVLDYLWDAGKAFHKGVNPQSTRWVMNKLRLLLEGKVGHVVGALKRELQRRHLRKPGAKYVIKAIRYLTRNRDYMAYDVYLARGYPVATGVIEGACRHLVKDRMEATGMRWTIDGAQATLDLRSVELNGDWRDFWDYRIARERQRNYPRAKAA